MDSGAFAKARGNSGMTGGEGIGSEIHQTTNTQRSTLNVQPSMKEGRRHLDSEESDFILRPAERL